VHHPAFILSYAKYVYPKFASIGLPDQLKNYFLINKDVLEKHVGWINNNILSALSAK